MYIFFHRDHLMHVQDGIIYELCEQEAPCMPAGPVVSSMKIPCISAIELLCYVIPTTAHTLNNFFLSQRPSDACAGR